MGLFSKKTAATPPPKKHGIEYVPPVKPPEAKPPRETPALVKKLFGDYDWPKFRILIGAALFCVLWAVLWFRAWYLQVIAAPELAAKASEQHEFTEQVNGGRGKILDRNGQVMARSVEAFSIYATPAKMRDKLKAANTIAPILGLDPKKLHQRFTKAKSPFIWLKRKVDDYTGSKILAANVAGIGVKTEYTRVYPFKHMAGQLLGFVNTDGKGLEGLERSLDRRLSAPKVCQVVKRDARGHKFYSNDADITAVKGEDIKLTLDMQMQYFAEEAISRAVREYDARWGGVLVVDVKSGDIMAWAQFPFFNPNSYSEYGTIIYRNRLAQDALEPGSTFKPLVMALALQEHKVSPDTLINCEGGRWTNKNFTIRDTSILGTISASKIIRYSSNIGMAKIGLSIGTRRYYEYLKNLGFGQRTELPLSESRGILRIPRDWSTIDIMSTSFGQSISVTGLQMAQAYLTLLNGGVYKPLRLLLDDNSEEQQRPRVCSEKAAKQVMSMMRDVVEAKDGTGRRARIEGLEVAGKTGTAQKADRRSKTYGSKRLASFVGFLPAKDPDFLIVVMVDEPSLNQFGGVVSAPVFSEVGAKVMTYTGKMSSQKIVASDLATTPKEKEEEPKVKLRPFKLAVWEAPWEIKNPTWDLDLQAKAKIKAAPQPKVKDLPGQLAKASSRVPDVKGKSLRNAVELFARAGVVPKLVGSGNMVIKQFPAPGSMWPEGHEPGKYTLWLSER